MIVLREIRFGLRNAIAAAAATVFIAAADAAGQAQPSEVKPLVAPAPSAAASIATGAEATQADAFFRRREWADAARSYEAIARREPANALAWLRLGHSLHSLSRYPEAAAAYRQAAEHAATTQAATPVRYRLARVYALMNDKEAAFSWLRRALEGGFSQVQMLNTEPDLAALRDDPRFAEVAAQAAVNAKPCSRLAAARQFDFWLGEWDVEAAGQQAGTNSVQLILGDCVLFENWVGAGGMQGKSFNVYNTGTGRWQQTWVDDRGSVTQLTGEYKDGAMSLTGETTLRDEKKVLHRLTFFNLAAGRVRQLWEQSHDEGRTWNVAFDGTYTRKK